MISPGVAVCSLVARVRCVGRHLSAESEGVKATQLSIGPGDHDRRSVRRRRLVCALSGVSLLLAGVSSGDDAKAGAPASALSGVAATADTQPSDTESSPAGTVAGQPPETTDGSEEQAPPPELDARGSAFITSATNATITLLMEQPELAEEAGVDIEWVTVRGAQESLVALLAGEVDFAYASLPQVLGAIAAGEDLVAFASVHAIPTAVVLSNEFIASTGVSADAPLADRLLALEGAKIASSALGHSHPLNIQLAMDEEGLDVEYADIAENITLVDAVAQAEGIRAGQFDGSAWSYGSMNALIEEGVASLWINLPAEVDLLSELPSTVLVAHRAWVDANPETVEALHGAYVNSVEFLNENFEEASPIIKEATFPDMTEEQWDDALRGVMPVFPSGATTSEEGWQITLDSTVAADPDADFTGITADAVIHPLMRDGW